MDAISQTGSSGGSGFSLTEAIGGTKATKDQFLTLLVTQLKNQNPFEPLQNEDFLTQLATFSQLEEQQSGNKALQDLVALQNASLVLGGLSQGAGLVGKQVTYLDPDSDQPTQGLVRSVSFEPTGVMLDIDGRTVPVGNIIRIGLPTTGEPQPTEPEPTPGTGGPTGGATPPSTNPSASGGSSSGSEQEPGPSAASAEG